MKRVAERDGGLSPPMGLPALIIPADISVLIHSLGMEQQKALCVLLDFLQAVCASPTTLMQSANLSTVVVGALLNRDLGGFNGDPQKMSAQMKSDGACVQALITGYVAAVERPRFELARRVELSSSPNKLVAGDLEQKLAEEAQQLKAERVAKRGANLCPVVPAAAVLRAAFSH